MLITGKVQLVCKDSNGNIIWETPKMKNVITNLGKAQIAYNAGHSGTFFTYIAVGTGTTAEDATQTALVAEITDTGLARAAGTITNPTTTVAGDTHRVTYTWTASGTKTIQEVGVFTGITSGTMFGRKLTGAKVINNTEQLTATYDFIFS